MGGHPAPAALLAPSHVPASGVGHGNRVLLPALEKLPLVPSAEAAQGDSASARGQPCLAGARGAARALAAPDLAALAQPFPSLSPRPFKMKQ